jgi:D-alanyl-D-alanine carboxypeptidase/D-alanyl-D-alanine-endopeptidase (penicillin-binding protein 4)
VPGFKSWLINSCVPRRISPMINIPLFASRVACVALCLVATATGAAELPSSVALALKNAGIPASAVGVVAQRVDEARPRVAVNAGVPMNPASTIKLVTTYAALERLGPAYTWQTEAWISGALVNGILEGDLHLKGGGDPKLTYEQFSRLLRQLRQRGVREIRGDLVLDRSAFDVPEVDPGSFDAQPLRPYNVGPDALLVNFNAVSLNLIPDSASGTLGVIQEPPLATLDIVNKVRVTTQNGCGDWKEGLRADTFTHGQVVRLVLSGSYAAACGEQRWNLAVMQNRLFVFGVFKSLWEELGGRFTGNLRESEVPSSARRITVLPAPTLAEIVRDINKFSNNVMARQLFLTLGMAAGSRPARLEDGDKAVREWLAVKGLNFPELVMENGSGLGRQARISAENMNRLLQAGWRSAVMPELMSSLPVSAVDGTMRKRLKENGVAGQAHIKTGSLEGVKTIAGYVLDRQGRRWVVVFLVNHPKAILAGPAQDALLEWVHAQ